MVDAVDAGRDAYDSRHRFPNYTPHEISDPRCAATLPGYDNHRRGAKRRRHRYAYARGKFPEARIGIPDVNTQS